MSDKGCLTSPGMKYGSTKQTYQVIGLTNTGNDRVIADYPGN